MYIIGSISKIIHESEATQPAHFHIHIFINTAMVIVPAAVNNLTLFMLTASQHTTHIPKNGRFASHLAKISKRNVLLWFHVDHNLNIFTSSSHLPITANPSFNDVWFNHVLHAQFTHTHTLTAHTLQIIGIKTFSFSSCLFLFLLCFLLLYHGAVVLPPFLHRLAPQRVSEVSTNRVTILLKWSGRAAQFNCA